MSGTAHGLLWHHEGNSGVTIRPPRRWQRRRGHSGDVATLFMDEMTALHITSRGFKLLGERPGWPTLTSGIAPGPGSVASPTAGQRSPREGSLRYRSQ